MPNEMIVLVVLENESGRVVSTQQTRVTALWVVAPNLPRAPCFF